MKFSESVTRRLPKRPIPSEEYTVLARSRYNRRYGIERTERVNPQELAAVPDILQKVGFVVVCNILADSATVKVRSASLRNKLVVATLQEAWRRVHDTEQAHIGWVSNEPGTGLRFNHPGKHMVIPADARQNVTVTQQWRSAEACLRPGDALAWEQGESYFPSVELHNTSQHYVGAFVLHDSVIYANAPVASSMPSVSQ